MSRRRSSSLASRAIRERLVRLAMAVTAAVMLLSLDAAPAGAEIDDEQKSFWGLDTRGASNTVGSWDGLGWAIEQIDDTIFVGGNYLDVTNGSRRERQPYLAAFDSNGGKWRSWFSPDVGDAVFALEASSDGALFVGGEMGSWNGATVGGLMKVDPITGDPWPGWNTRVYGGVSVVRDLKLEADGWLYVVGGFTTASHFGQPQSVAGAIRIDPVTGAIDPTWKPSVDGSVWGVSRSKTMDRVYLAGHFDYVNGQNNTGGFVAVDDDGTVVVERLPAVPLNNCSNPGYCFEMYDVEATTAGTVFVAGVEHALYVMNETEMVPFINHYTWCLDGFTDCQAKNRRGGEFQEIEVIDNRVYATCHCWASHWSHPDTIQHRDPVGDHSTVSSVIAYDPATGERITSMNPYMSGQTGGFAIHGDPSDGCLWLAGGFNSVGATDVAPGRDLVRLCDEAGPGPAATPVTPAPGVPSCSATLDGGGTEATIAWTPADGADSYVIRRSTDGAVAQWRGRTGGLSFTDSVPSGRVHQYEVAVRYPAGQLSQPTLCGDPLDLQPVPVSAPSQCTVQIVGDLAEVTWSTVSEAASYIVYRSVDGSRDFWRAKVAAPTTAFDDSLLVGVPIEFRVRAVDIHFDSSELATCGPAVTLQAASLAAPTSCSVAVSGTTGTVTWPAAAGATKYRVYRSVGGGTAFWRGAPTTNQLTDQLRSDAPLAYFVRSVGADGTATSSTACNPVVDLTGANGPAPVGGAPATCAAAVDGSTAVVTWTAVAGATDYVIFRTVDAGGEFWRGKVSAPATSFGDPLRNGTTVYRVLAIAADGTKSTKTTCTPTLTF